MRPNDYSVPLEQRAQLVSAKRTRRERLGIHAWHPYYAGYSEGFVESAIDYLKLDDNSTILDPWGGSGTTSIVASRRGIASINAEINPVMSTFAAAKSPVVMSAKEELLTFFDGLRPAGGRKPPTQTNDTLEAILCPDTAKVVRRLVEQIPTRNDRGVDINCPFSAFALAVFFVCLRRLGGAKRLANPTWLKTYDEKLSVEPRALVEELQKTAKGMLADLEKFYGDASHPAKFEIVTSDVRTLPIPDVSVDAVITSPPYLTRIDYAVSTLPEMMFFGDMLHLETIRHATMGAPVIKKIERAKREIWGKRCNDLLDSIANHGSKAAKSYYWKNIIQYFMDMEDSLSEIKRVMRNGASGIIVVQSSYFKEHEIALGEMYVEMCENMGFHAEIAFREKVKTHMAHVNTKSSAYVKNKVYHEDFIHFGKCK
ncbi:hypothetical protein AB9E19_14655 [Rhizobium leguminosarum]|uniref:hypothetical protein n=1 Tax=Rhizobium leguminosarum TaxID=384 RepID=UPI003F97D976